MTRINRTKMLTDKIIVGFAMFAVFFGGQPDRSA